MWRKLATAAVSLIAVIFVPVALLALVLPVNDYEAQGMGGLADCDGPPIIMFLAVSSLAVYAAGGVYYFVLLKGWKRGVLTVLCAVVVLAAGLRVWAAYRETLRPVHRSACGEDR